MPLVSINNASMPRFSSGEVWSMVFKKMNNHKYIFSCCGSLSGMIAESSASWSCATKNWYTGLIGTPPTKLTNCQSDLALFGKIKKTDDSFPSCIFKRANFEVLVVLRHYFRKFWICSNDDWYVSRSVMIRVAFLKNHPALIMHLPTISLIVRFWKRGRKWLLAERRAQFHRYYHLSWCRVVWEQPGKASF